jgi:imidazole glycerol-phosphate synthase subunit HisF
MRVWRRVLRRRRAKQSVRGAISSGKIWSAWPEASRKLLLPVMLTKRIIACLDVNAGRVVKGVQFKELRDAGDPAELAAAHSKAGADEVVLLDISATHEKRTTLADTVRRAARQLFIPFTVGGGIRSLDDAIAVFEAGADKISINSATLADPSLITRIADRYGSQAIIVAIDAKRVNGEARFEAYVSGGRNPTGRDAVGWAREAEERGAGEILLTSMDCDGTGAGFDCDLTRACSEGLNIPVIASGGGGDTQSFVDVFERGRADAALAASIFHFGLHRLGDLKQELQSAGIPVRWPC